MPSPEADPFVLWLTGLPAAGKSTLAGLIEAELTRRGRRVHVLDGDRLRRGLNSDLGYSAADRRENVRRISEVARMMVDAGSVVIVACIAPFRADRALARARFAPRAFLELHVDAPLAVVEQRDPNGLYRRARRGELRDVTGIDSPYEAPESPEIRIDTTSGSPAQAAATVTSWLEQRGYLVAYGSACVS